MNRPYTIRLTGENAADAAHALGRRLVELGSNVCPPGQAPPAGFDGVVLLLGDAPSDAPAGGTVEISAHDTPDFAAEKISTSSTKTASFRWNPKGIPRGGGRDPETIVRLGVY